MGSLPQESTWLVLEPWMGCCLVALFSPFLLKMVVNLTQNMKNIYGVSLVVQTVNNLPVMQETWVQSLSW